jgi:hypothetical protein
MTSIRAAFIRELGPYNKRKSNVIYKKWVKEAGGVIRGGGDENVIDSPTSHGTELAPAVEENTLISSNSKLVVSLRLLKRSNEDQMKKIYKLLKNLPNTIHYYLENFVFPVYMDNKITKLSYDLFSNSLPEYKFFKLTLLLEIKQLQRNLKMYFLEKFL